jgi:hypothetical protein
MQTKELVAQLYSDDTYKQFICQSSWLYFQGLITTEEYQKRIDAVNEQIKKQ